MHLSSSDIISNELSEKNSSLGNVPTFQNAIKYLQIACFKNLGQIVRIFIDISIII